MDNNFKIFVIKGDEEIKEIAAEAGELNSDINNLLEEINDVHAQLTNVESKLTMYISNAIKNEYPFDISIHTPVFGKDNKVYIHHIKDVDNIICEIEEDDEIENINYIFESDILDKLPEPLYTTQLNKKQISTCKKLMYACSEILQVYMDCKYEIDFSYSYFGLLVDEVKNHLIENRVFSVITKDTLKNSLVEKYNEDKHEILLIRDNSNEWGFIYINKDQKNDFINSVKNHKKN